MRTNIDIDDELMREAMRATGAKTKKAAVDAALRRLVEVRAEEAKRLEFVRRRRGKSEPADHDNWLEEWLATGWESGREESSTRTNIEIDDSLLQRAMELSPRTTKKAVVEEALRLAVQLDRQKEAIEKLWGIGWEGDLDEMRETRFPDWDEPKSTMPETANEPAA